MATDAIVIVAFLAIDFGLVLAGLMYLAEQRAARDHTDVRRRDRRYRW